MNNKLYLIKENPGQNIAILETYEDMNPVILKLKIEQMLSEHYCEDCEILDELKPENFKAIIGENKLWFTGQNLVKY